MEKPQSDNRLLRWRLVLGSPSDPSKEVGLTRINESSKDSKEEDEKTSEEKGQQSKSNDPSKSTNYQEIDNTLEALYDSDRMGNLGSSTPNVNRWLGNIKKYFPNEVVQILQKDALDKLGVEHMLLQSEIYDEIVPDVQLVTTILSLQEAMPSQTRESAKHVVQKLVDQLLKKLKPKFNQDLRGALRRSGYTSRPQMKDLDWKRTIKLNLQNYQPEYKTIILERLKGFKRTNPALKKIILLVDQSGSMASSMVYASICGAILASISALKVHFVIFDTSVVDLSEIVQDPIDLLFAAQLGGGTDIQKALSYAYSLIDSPMNTYIFLISDLYEGGTENQVIDKSALILHKGAKLINLLALSDDGKPAYNKTLAKKLNQLNVPSIAATPEALAKILGNLIEGKPIT